MPHDIVLYKLAVDGDILPSKHSVSVEVGHGLEVFVYSLSVLMLFVDWHRACINVLQKLEQ